MKPALKKFFDLRKQKLELRAKAMEKVAARRTSEKTAVQKDRKIDEQNLQELSKQEPIKTVKTNNPGFGYHGVAHYVFGKKDGDARYSKIHARVKKFVGSNDDIEVRDYLDSHHGKLLSGHEANEKYVRRDFKNFKKQYNPAHYVKSNGKGGTNAK